MPFFKKNNKISPDSTPPQKTHQRKLTPIVDNFFDSTSKSFSTSNSTEMYTEKMYVPILDEKIESHGDILKTLDSQGISASMIFGEEKEAFDVMKKTHPTKSFTIHEFEVPMNQLSIKENSQHEEIYKFDGLANWSSARKFSPDLPISKGMRIHPKDIFYTAYTVIVGSTSEIISLKDNYSKIPTSFPPIFYSPQNAFDDARNSYKNHSLTLMKLNIPLSDKNNLEVSHSVIKYLIDHAASITSYTQSAQKFEDGKIIGNKNNSDSVTNAPRLKK